MVPLHALAKIHPGKYDEDAKRDDFLDDFELIGGEFAVADAVGGHLKAIFGKRNQPAHDDGQDERRLAIFKVPIPGDGHERVGANQEQDGFHRRES